MITNPYIPNFENAGIGDIVFHAGFGKQCIDIKRTDPYYAAMALQFSTEIIPEWNLATRYQTNVQFDNHGFEFRHHAKRQRHPTVFQTKAQCKNYWVWEWYASSVRSK